MKAPNPPRVELDSITSLVVADLQRVEQELHRGLQSVAPEIALVGEHTLAGGGKMLRPMLVLLAARLCGYEGPAAVLVGAAIEYLHTASLLHDDVVDGAQLRRGRPSANAHFGERLAVLVGDFMYARACQLLVEEGNHGILEIFADVLGHMSEGEVLQLSQSFDPQISQEVYTQVISRKTARLIAVASESGALLAALGSDGRAALREYGRQIGLAFQLVDDALDYRGVGKELGKMPLQDLREGKVTLPLILTLERCSVAERDQMLSILKVRSAADPSEPCEDIQAVAQCVQRHHGVDSTLDLAHTHAASARACIDAFAPCPAKEALIRLSEFVVQRNH